MPHLNSFPCLYT
uniref:Uncharacterized protein n=1 Tax=Anguilla anguilla TaxID=7936 RepID=A0A0E9Q4E1_ANGAN